MRRLRGIKDLVIAAIAGGNQLTEESHRLVSAYVFGALRLVPSLRPLAEELEQGEELVSDAVYAAIRGTTKLVGASMDVGFDAVERWSPTDPVDVSVPRSDLAPSPAWAKDAALGVLNGIVGDFLHETENRLAIDMRLQTASRCLPRERQLLRQLLAGSSPRLCIMVHGLAATPWSFSYRADEVHGDPTCTYATMLERDLGYTCLYLHYNSGLPIHENGRQFANLLGELVADYPGTLESICLIGHSMGGLVVRSACNVACAEEMSWPSRLGHVFCLGSPHQGAPLEKLGHVLEEILRVIPAPAPHVLSRILEQRSQGIRDLRRGEIDPSPEGFGEPTQAWDKTLRALQQLRVAFFAASVTADPGDPLSQALGDTLVRIPSALNTPSPIRARAEESARGPTSDEMTRRVERHVFPGLSHLDLANHPKVYDEILRRLSD